METDFAGGGFLSNTRLVLAAVDHILSTEAAGEVFLCGAALKVILENFLNTTDLEFLKHRLLAVVPNLSTLGSPLYAKLYDIACQIRVSPVAAHNLIVTDNYCLFLSVAENSGTEHKLSGVLIKNAEDVKKARQFCREINAKAFPLQVG